MSSQPPLPVPVGFVGATGAGKTALAQLLVERHGFCRMHMGQPIKDMLVGLGLSSDDVATLRREDPHPLLSGRSPRFAMQTLGTQWGREMISPDIWALAVERRIVGHRTTDVRPIVIDDLRFPNDWAMCQRLNGVIVRVRRPNAGPSRRACLDHIAHKSEVARRLAQMVGWRPLHATEYHWYDAPAQVEVVNDRDLEATFERMVALIGRVAAS